MVRREMPRAGFRGIVFSPDDGIDEVPAPENFIHDDLEVMSLVVVDGYPDRAVLRQQIMQEFEARPHHRQPPRMLQIVVVMLEGRARVVGRVDMDALHASRIERQQRLQRFQVVTLDQQVAGVRIPRREVAGLLQQPVGHVGSGAKILVSRQPVQNRHGLAPFPSLLSIVYRASRLFIASRAPSGRLSYISDTRFGSLIMALAMRLTKSNRLRAVAWSSRRSSWPGCKDPID